MAVLGKIREHPKLVLLVVAGAIGLFVVQDTINSGGSSSSSISAIGSISGNDLEYADFSDALDLIKNSEQYQTYSDGDQKSLAWEKVIQDNLIKSRSNSIGLDVTKKEIYEFQTGNTNINNVSPHFLNSFVNEETGQFDRSFVDNWLDNQNQWTVEQREFFLGLQEEAIKTRSTQKYQALIEKGMYTTRQEAKNVLNSRSQNAAVQYVFIPYSSVEDVEVSDLEIKEYYNENISSYQNDKETRNVEYVTFTVVPSSDDDIKIKEELTDLVNDFANSDDDESFSQRYSNPTIESFPYLRKDEVVDPKFSELITQEIGTVVGPYKLTNNTYRLSKNSEIVLRPDSVEARHILLSLDNYTLDSAKTRIREIKQEIQEGKDFGKLASDLSDDTGSKIKGGDLGWFQEGLMVPEFSEACFSSEVRDLKIVRTDVGMHLIEITAVSDLVKKYKIVYLDQNVIATQTTEQDYYGQAHDFINTFKESDNISFKSFSEDQNQLVREDVNVDNMKFNISGLEDSREIVKWMFEDGRNEGEVSESIFACDKHYVVVNLSLINYKGDKKMESVKDEIMQEIQINKKFKIISDRISSNSKLEDLTSLFTVEIDTVDKVNFANTNISIGNESNFVGVVNAIPIGERSSAFQGSNGVFVIDVISKLDNGISEVQQNQRLDIQQTNSQNIFFNSVMRVLKENADIVDNRIEYY